MRVSALHNSPLLNLWPGLNLANTTPSSDHLCIRPYLTKQRFSWIVKYDKFFHIYLKLSRWRQKHMTTRSNKGAVITMHLLNSRCKRVVWRWDTLICCQLSLLIVSSVLTRNQPVSWDKIICDQPSVYLCTHYWMFHYCDHLGMFLQSGIIAMSE